MKKDFTPNFYGSLKFNLTVCISSQFPNTLLGNKILRMKYFCRRNQMIILLRLVSELTSETEVLKVMLKKHFRSPAIFDMIFYFYQSGGRFLYRPNSISITEFVDDMMFYKLNTYCRYGPR